MAVINYIGRHLTTYDVIKHCHENWEIIYTTSGKGKLITSEDVEINYQSNEAVIIPPNVMHTNNSDSGFNNIHLTLDKWKPNIKNTLLVSDNANKDLFYAMQQAHHHFHSNFDGRANVIFALTDLITAYVEMLASNPVVSSITQIIESEIITCYTDPNFEIAHIFNKIPYSKEYARKLFIKDRGISPLQFLINKRIMYAAKQLASRNQSSDTNNIREIAEKSGFIDQLYFSRQFKRVMGVSPRDYHPQELDDNKIISN